MFSRWPPKSYRILHCLMYLGIFVGVCVGLCFAMYLLDEEENDSCFALIVFLVYYDCNCSVTLPHDAVG